LVLCITVGGSFLYVFFPKNTISSIYISNVADTGATISWITTSETHGEVYLKEENSWIPLFAGAGSTVVHDVQTTENYTHQGYIHSVQLTDLVPETTYFFRIGEHLIGFDSNSDDLTFVDTFTTTKTPKNLMPPKPLYGKIEDANGEAPYIKSLVLVRIKNGSEIITRGGLTNVSGGWTADIANLLDQNGEPFALEENVLVELFVDAGPYGTTTFESVVVRNSPMPVLRLPGFSANTQHDLSQSTYSEVFAQTLNTDDHDDCSAIRNNSSLWGGAGAYCYDDRILYCSSNGQAYSVDTCGGAGCRVMPPGTPDACNKVTQEPEPPITVSCASPKFQSWYDEDRCEAFATIEVELNGSCQKQSNVLWNKPLEELRRVPICTPENESLEPQPSCSDHGYENGIRFGAYTTSIDLGNVELYCERQGSSTYGVSNDSLYCCKEKIQPVSYSCQDKGVDYATMVHTSYIDGQESKGYICDKAAADEPNPKYYCCKKSQPMYNPPEDPKCNINYTAFLEGTASSEYECQDTINGRDNYECCKKVELEPSEPVRTPPSTVVEQVTCKGEYPIKKHVTNAGSDLYECIATVDDTYRCCKEREVEKPSEDFFDIRFGTMPTELTFIQGKEVSFTLPIEIQGTIPSGMSTVLIQIYYKGGIMDEVDYDVYNNSSYLLQQKIYSGQSPELKFDTDLATPGDFELEAKIVLADHVTSNNQSSFVITIEPHSQQEDREIPTTLAQRIEAINSQGYFRLNGIFTSGDLDAFEEASRMLSKPEWSKFAEAAELMLWESVDMETLDEHDKPLYCDSLNALACVYLNPSGNNYQTYIDSELSQTYSREVVLTTIFHEIAHVVLHTSNLSHIQLANLLRTIGFVDCNNPIVPIFSKDKNHTFYCQNGKFDTLPRSYSMSNYHEWFATVVGEGASSYPNNAPFYTEPNYLNSHPLQCNLVKLFSKNPTINCSSKKYNITLQTLETSYLDYSTDNYIEYKNTCRFLYTINCGDYAQYVYSENAKNTLSNHSINVYLGGSGSELTGFDNNTCTQKIITSDYNELLDKFYGTYGLMYCLNTSGLSEFDLLPIPSLNEEYPDFGLEEPPNTNVASVEEENGIYALTFAGEVTKEVEIFSIDGNTGRLEFYTDENGNGIRDEGEPLFSVHRDDFSLEKIADLVVYDIPVGWSLVSFPLELQTEQSVSTAAELIRYANGNGGYITTVSAYRNGQWVTYSERDGQAYSNDFELLPGEGYFLKSDQSFLLKLRGKKVAETLPLELNHGWNLVGIVAPNESYTADSFLNHVQTQDINADIVSKWEYGIYYNYIVEDSIGYGIDFNLYNTAGYFVRVDGEGGEVEV
jgi:hypothetical protein